MHENHIIPISSGLFEHRERIGPAIWEFLWCIDAITAEETDSDGARWGLVHGGAPVKHERIALEIGSSQVTVQRNMANLKSRGYIHSVRTARGEIIKVAKNKKVTDPKRYIKNDRSLESDLSKMIDHSESDTSKMIDHSESDTSKMIDHSESDTSKMIDHSERYIKNDRSHASDLSKMIDLKDFKDLNTITTTITYPNYEPEKKSPLMQLLNAYCQLNKKFDIHVKPKEREAMGKMVAGGMPNPFTIRTMELLLEDKRKREGNSFKLPTSFLYYENGIWEAWRNENAQTIPVSSGEVAPGTAHKTKQEQAFSMLDQIAREERERGQSGSLPAAQEN
ncbi:helix-turn-helix domain-containing protein [Paenibacillus ferrarius]|uniref:helix-turn-helix domain-containing protein n=1 Tax=Paenibacillus ferrarius TaxID=1469647 RepID=UPI003D2880AA